MLGLSTVNLGALIKEAILLSVFIGHAHVSLLLVYIGWLFILGIAGGLPWLVGDCLFETTIGRLSEVIAAFIHNV